MIKPIFTFILCASIFALLQNCRNKEQNSNDHSPIFLETASFEVLDSAFYHYINVESKIEIIASGHEWTEGPVWVESEKMLLYSDIPNNAIYSWKEGESAKLYLKNAGGSSISNEGANGLFIKGDTLILCQHGARQIAYMNASLSNPSNSFVTMVNSYEGAKLNSPNDLTYSRNGNLFFTDPPYGLDKEDEDPSKELTHNGVYFRSKDSTIKLLLTDFTRPNGLALSVDENHLIVANSDRKAAYWYRFTINDDNTLSNKTLLFDATDKVNNTNTGLPDGLEVHSSGAVFATGPGGLYIFSPDYDLLGIIRTERATSNIAFDTNEENLFLTADDIILRIKLNK